MNLRVNHVALTVTDLDESVQWYAQKLGFELIGKYQKNGMNIALIKSGDVRLELFNFDDDTKDLPNYRQNLIDDLHVIGTKHVSLEVDDIDGIIKQLRNSKVEFVTDVDTAALGGRYIFFKDCNGILIELFEN